MQTSCWRAALLSLLLVVTSVASEEKAIFAAGCFWSVELAFQRVPGVISTSVGYAGGRTTNPTYRDVTTGTTGHAEAVEVVYDSSKLPFEKLCSLFWNIHDPTTKNQQGGDIGTQYRSAIFYNTDEQLAAIRRSEEAFILEYPEVSSRISTEIGQMDSSFKYW
jgi:peptide-methionine (S)-S-oxide reductase